MDTKRLSLIIVIAAVTIVLSPSISRIAIPFPLAPFLLFGIWEIPIIAAFVFISRKAGIAIAVINAIGLTILFPGALPTGPLYNLIAILSMLLGIYIIQIILKTGHKFKMESKYNETKFVILSTSLAIILRVGVMTGVNYVVLRYPYPIGYELDQLVILAYLPIIALFNAIVAFYTVPLGLYLARAVNRYLKI